MNYWRLSIGLMLIAIGLSMLFGLGDLLPIELWMSVRSWFGLDHSGIENYRIIATANEASQFIEHLFIGGGLAFLGFSAYFHFKK